MWQDGLLAFDRWLLAFQAVAERTESKLLHHLNSLSIPIKEQFHLPTNRKNQTAFDTIAMAGLTLYCYLIRVYPFQKWQLRPKWQVNRKILPLGFLTIPRTKNVRRYLLLTTKVENFSELVHVKCAFDHSRTNSILCSSKSQGRQSRAWCFIKRERPTWDVLHSPLTTDRWRALNWNGKNECIKGFSFLQVADNGSVKWS